MEVPFSPSRSEAFHLSPSHLRHVDPMQELRNLRRSMSRSPSKMNKHTASPLGCSPSHTPGSPLAFAHNAPELPTTLRQSTRELESFSSTKKSKPTLARSTPIKGFLRMTRPEPQSSTSALAESSDFGNGSSSSQERSDGQENQTHTPQHSRPQQGVSTLEFSKPKIQSVPFRTPAMRTRPAISYDLQLDTGLPAKSSPLKRNDGAMKLNNSSLGSPSAKRRSLHGVPFEIAHDLANINTPVDNNLVSDNDSSPDDHPFRSTVARGYAGLRRPHLQQRLSQKAGANRNRRSLEISFATPPPVRRSSNRNKPRSSLDSPSPQTQGEHDGSHQTFPSSPHINESTATHHARHTRQQPHPLSKALTPTSPNPESFSTGLPSLESSSSHAPVRPSNAFSKSLPIGAFRPRAHDYQGNGHEPSTQEEDSFATPRLFDIARPDPAAFRSTGLISKRYRHPDDMPPPQITHADMPDTPCKKTSTGFYISPSPNPVHHGANTSLAQPAFGTPSQPFALQSTQAAPNSFSRSTGLFGKDVCDRRVSFTSNDGEDATQSPNQPREMQGDSQSSADELPPTPTKHGSSLFGIKSSSLRSSLFGRRSSVGPSTFMSPPGQEDQPNAQQLSGEYHKPDLVPDSGNARLDPSGKLDSSGGASSLDNFRTPPSFARSRFERSNTLHPPSPLSHKASRPRCVQPSSLNIAKHSLRSSGSSSNARKSIHNVPHTPADSGFPDPSVLSISPSAKVPVSPSYRHSLGSSFARPPETPTSHRESAQSLNNGLLVTPNHYTAPYQDVDRVLTQKFKKAEWYAKGEFSEVYKVYEAVERPQSVFASASHSFKSLQGQLPDRVFVVKKSKAPHTSVKLREKKLREASIMKSLGRSDHTVSLVDSWEANHHFYLQMEYCEEGSLDGFLVRQGRDGRLDDFRIWKIMVELTLGVKHIHDSGFIHLDLKPENIFIDFEGSLKIGDFGLASSWPAPANVEGEGDRRYIGPDLLLGAFDKPADIFAMGMIMYEIAANAIPPDNGGWWQKLRSGDFSGLPSLTSGSSNSLSKDSHAHFNTDDSLERLGSAGMAEPPLFSPSFDSHTSIDTRMTSWEPENNAVGAELLQPPAFMLNPNDPESLDNVVQWMMSPSPSDRPVVNTILQLAGCEWVSGRRRAGAVIYEGRWGPADHVLAPKAEDTEMTDA